VSETVLSEFLEQQVHRAFDDFCEVATRVRVAHEVPAKLELFAELRAYRELHAKPLVRQRLEVTSIHPCPSNRRRCVGSWKTRSQVHLNLAFRHAADCGKKFFVILVGEPLAH
jgi:hypothetical protein